MREVRKVEFDIDQCKELQKAFGTLSQIDTTLMAVLVAAAEKKHEMLRQVWDQVYELAGADQETEEIEIEWLTRRFVVTKK